MEKCVYFLNYHCAVECPNHGIESSEILFGCSECSFNDTYATCNDCMFFVNGRCTEDDGSGVGKAFNSDMEV